ncbi:hypothetical protein JCGZ_04100 [Jatropha curcas]|uniref:Uncharacterized protein n=1 Tax=Jatropha curcas TaxID=180498 RepID=A0A067KRM3_JATCU|nr:tetratricopeptide repeat protein 1 [Jatropha curcas]KDP38747.1 hypothetical protein JCGZ_04100 [Jatropha curcas]
MVVIEPQEGNEETLVNNPPKLKATTSSSSSTDSSKDTKTTAPPIAEASAATSVNGNDSDGFETASEREMSDNEELDNEEISHHLNEHKHQPPPSTTTQEGKAKVEPGCSQDDDELQQKALAQANDAKLEGNKLFGDGRYEEALLKYDAALQVALDIPSFVELRSICHANRAVCFLKLGKYEDTIKECTKALELNPSYIKPLVRRGEAHEKLEQFEEAIADMKKTLELDPSNDQAKKAIRRLEPLAAEKREKMKEEMIAKLKDMGNSLLGRFGMSIDNFKAVKDPNTGSYSLSFQR